MPSYKNFKSSFSRRTEQDNVFKNPKIMTSGIISKEREERLIEWITFYRRNIHRFIEHYFGIALFPYQIAWVYLMSISDSFVAICSRATGKSWLVAVFACAKAVLYPNSEIIVVSSTKAQAGIIVDKIINLRNDHPNLAREISNVVANMNVREVVFHNGSSIKVLATRDSSRGNRSTFTIYEEFRLIDKEILDAVIRPFAYVRQTPYLKIPEYSHLKEESKEVFISSAYHKGLWWFDETKKTIKNMLNGDNSRFIALDYLLAIKHGIKTQRQIKNEISKMDEVTALEEYLNIPWGESADAYFKLKMFDKARKIQKAFYPQIMRTYNPKKNPYDIPRTDGELRILSCDIAQRPGKANDLSISVCVRLLPTHKGYFRELVFMESHVGRNSILQALRIKQLYHDFGADYIVLDVANAGITLMDSLGVISKDDERDIEYPAMTVMDHPSIDQSIIDELTTRTLGLNSLPVIYPVSGTGKLNSQIAVEMRDRLQKKMWGFLYDVPKAEDYLINSKDSKEFMDYQSFYISPYYQTSLFVNECINLSMMMVAGNIKLVEPSGSRKDRYTAVSYANYFVSFFDQDLIRDEDTSDDYDYIAALVQST